MDYVLDTLLTSLLELVPCDSARVLLAETEDRLFLAREHRLSPGTSGSHTSPMTWSTSDHAPLAQVFSTQELLLVRNTAECEGWKQFKGHSHFHSWLGVPLTASGNVLGLLSLGASQAHVFTQEHLRLAKSLAIPAAVAIQNARLYERAEIYGSELEKRLADLEQVEQAREEAEKNKALSAEQFNQIFRENPIPFVIATLEDGRFIDVNGAFERTYGYSRDQLIGRTILEVGICEGPNDREQLLQEVGGRGVLRNYPTRIRKHSGEFSEVTLSANILEGPGQRRILLATEELRERLIGAPRKARDAHAPA